MPIETSTQLYKRLNDLYDGFAECDCEKCRYHAETVGVTISTISSMAQRLHDVCTKYGEPLAVEPEPERPPSSRLQ
jgi:hypothetical protein